MLKQNTTLITQLFITLESRPEADMKTNENPLLYRIMVCLERETSHIYWLVSKLQQPAFMQQDNLYFWFLIWQLSFYMVRPTRAVTFAEYYNT